MALTRVTSSVLDSNAVSAEKIANSALTNRMYGVKSIGLKHLANDANLLVSIGNFNANTNLVESNVRQTSANAAAERANVLTITSNIVQNVANINLNKGTGVRLSLNLAANVNSVKANVDAAEANIAGILDGATFTGQINMSDDLIVAGNLTVNGDTTTSNSINATIQDRFLMLANGVSGTPSADVGIFMNRGTSGNAAIFYDESAKSFTMAETRDPDSNTVISPSGLANLAVGTLKYNGADLNTAITDNRSGAISTVYKDNLTASRAVVSNGSGKLVVSAVTATEIGYLDGVSSSIQTQLDAAGTTAAFQANDFVTFTRLNANINVVSSNIAVGLIRKVNVIASTDGEGAGNNNFFIATPPAGNPAVIDNIAVTIDGVTQAKTTDYLYTAGTGKITFKDAAIPTGLTVTITSLNPPT